jgi:hypothetical protein
VRGGMSCPDGAEAQNHRPSLSPGCVPLVVMWPQLKSSASLEPTELWLRERREMGSFRNRHGGTEDGPLPYASTL